MAHVPPDPATLIPSQRERRARIVRAALRLLERGDYEHIQMRDVADEADVALGTVYRYFASKEHLFAAVLVEWSASLQHRVQGSPLRGGDVPSQLIDLMDRVIGAFERLPQFFRLMILIETTADPYARQLHQEFTLHTHETFRAPLEPLGDDDATTVLEVVTAVLSGVLRGWAVGRLSSEEMHGRMRRAIALVFSSQPLVADHATRAAASA